MTVLTACQQAKIRLVGQKPTAVFSSPEQMDVELADLVDETAVAITKHYDWQALTKIYRITGDGTSIAHPLPDDYARMPVRADVHPKSWVTWRYTPAPSLDYWLDLLNGLPTVIPGFWIILEGQMQIFPPAQNGDEANFYYISKNFARAADGTPKDAFTLDSDTFVLDERLLTLGLIWRWRAQKRFEYAEDMENYEIALSQDVARDKGSHIIRSGNNRFGAGSRWAYPLPLGS